MALSTIGTAGLADDAVTAAKIDDDGTGFTFGDVTTGALTATGATTGIVTFDKLTLDGSSVATVTVNGAVSGSTTVAVDGVSGTIAVGMVVNVSDTTVRSITDASSESAISVDDTLTITAVASQTSFTVSEAVSIADNVVLILRADENSKMVLDASAASTDVGDEILFEDATGDPSVLSGVAGSVLQVVQGGRTTRVTHNSSTYGDVGVTATITPRSSSSKILIQLTGTLSNANASNLCLIRLFRGSTQIGSGTGGGTSNYNSFMSMLQDTTTYTFSGISGSFLDSPSTTSATTYKIQLAAYNGTAVMGGRPDNTNVATPTLLTLMEIAG